MKKMVRYITSVCNTDVLLRLSILPVGRDEILKKGEYTRVSGDRSLVFTVTPLCARLKCDRRDGKMRVSRYASILSLRLDFLTDNVIERSLIIG